MKAAPKPLIYSRAQWGANESIREQTPPAYGTIKTGFVHHTVNANNYTEDQVPSLIRGIYAYHVQSRGWRDIGYNFLVDRFGRIWEGRWGGIDKAVVGAHTLGYNEQSFAGSAIGNWDIATPPPAVADAFSRLMAWKLSLYNIPADAVHIWVKDKYFNAINGHRDAGSTACPGRYLYAQLPTIRTKAKAIQNAAQTGTPTPPPGPAPLAKPVTPLRVLDTRTGTGGVAARAVGANSTVTFTVTGKGEVPATGVAGVFLNLTATEPGAAGYVTAYPAGAARPTASSLNIVAGETRPNMVFVPVGTGANAGKVSLFNGSPSNVDLIADTAGYVLTSAAGKPGAATSVAPARVVDTRSGVGAAKSAVPAKGAIDVTIAGKGGVPATGAAGVWLNVTAVDPDTAGYVTVSPGGQTSPTSNLNFSAEQTVPNLVFVPLSGGKVRLFNGSTGPVQLVVDTAGYTVAGTPVDAGGVSSVPPARVLDTRIGTGAARAALQPGGVVTLKVRGRGNIPDSGSIAGVFLNVTATSPTKEGYITVYPAGAARPHASNLNYLPGKAIPNLVFAPINANGEIQLYNGSTGTVHLVADTAGYIKGTPAG